MFKKLEAVSLKNLKKMRYHTGLYAASLPNVSTGYDKAWIRDNIYVALGLESAKSINEAKAAYHAIFDILLKHEYKIDWAISEKPNAAYKYIHARFNPLTLEEIPEEWGNKQNDAIGAFLFKVGELYKKGIMVFRDENDLRILQKLVYYLASIEYWHDKDNGMWEENEEVHASSIGACVAGLIAVRRIVDVPDWLINKGHDALSRLLPNESETKKVDLALLSLIYPYNIVTNEQKIEILNNVEKHLVRKKGVIRYPKDLYYNNGSEAEWTFGFPWLALIYKNLGDMQKYNNYMKRTIESMTPRMELPELYYGGTDQPNENTPLAWSQAMLLCAIA
ncbi:MAG: glycoside hydrolase family 15 protein [Candidatus Woesearchaeota archaeon]